MDDKYNKKRKQQNNSSQKPNPEKEQNQEQKTSASASENEQLTEKERQQQETIDELLKRVKALGDKVQYLESSLSIAKTTSDNLEIMVDNQQQYLRRPCMVVSGMKAPGNEVSNSEDAESVITTLATESGINKNIIKQNVDKIHHISKIVEDQQQRIVKFTSDSFKEKIYLAQKERKKYEKRKHPVNFKPSLTRRRSCYRTLTRKQQTTTQ